jgi:polyisoprenoid-binding protein YceI
VADLEAGSVRTGIGRRDLDLCGPRFFDVATFDTIGFRARDVRADVEARDVEGREGAVRWTVTGWLRVRDVDAPLDLEVTLAPDDGTGGTGGRRVLATGVLDRSATGLRAPRWLVGRWITVTVEAYLRPAP